MSESEKISTDELIKLSLVKSLVDDKSENLAKTPEPQSKPPYLFIIGAAILVVFLIRQGKL